MKRWLLFLVSFILLLAISFSAFIFISRTRLIEAALTRNTALRCSIGSITFGMKQQSIHDLTCTLPDQSMLSIQDLTIDLSLFRASYWAVNPFMPLLPLGNCTASGIHFQTVASTSDFSHNGWKTWLESVQKQKGPITLHSIALNAVQLTVRNDALSGASLSPQTHSTIVIFAREPSSLQSILYEVVLTLLEDSSSQLGLPYLQPDHTPKIQ